MSRQQTQAPPKSVTRAIQILVGLVGLAGVTTVLTVVLRDEVARALAAGHPADTDIQPPSFVPIVVVMFIVFAGLTFVLVPFFRSGYNWSRFSLIGAVVFLGVATVAGMQTDPPTAFKVLAVASLVVDAALLFYLCHRDTTTYMRGDWAAPRVDV